MLKSNATLGAQPPEFGVVVVRQHPEETESDYYYYYYYHYHYHYYYDASYDEYDDDA